MLSGRAEITRARGLEFRVSGSRGPRAGDPYAFNVVVRLDARVEGRRIEGIGEAAPRGRALTGDTRAGSWRFLRTALRKLEGAVLPAGADSARSGIAPLVGELRGLAADASTRKSPVAPYRATLAGLETALLDVAAKAAQVSVAELLGGRRRPIPTAGVVSARSPERAFDKQAAACGSGPAVKVVDVVGLGSRP